MGILPYLMFVVARGVLLLVDVATLFVLIRLVCYWRPIRLLAGFDAAGKPLVDSFNQIAATCWERLGRSRVLSEPQNLVMTLGVLGVVQLLLGVVLSASS